MRGNLVVAALIGAAAYTLVSVTVGRSLRRAVTDARQHDRFVPLVGYGVTSAGEYLDFSAGSFAAHAGPLSIRARSGGALLKLGAPAVMNDQAGLVRRVIESGDATRLRSDRSGRLSGHLGETPADFGLEFSSLKIGNRDAWVVPAECTATVWVVHVHGLGSSRSQVLRGLPVFASLGFTSLVPTYRTSLDEGAERARFSHLGVTEWQDVLSAYEYAVSSGAQRIIFVGWSLGASIVLRALERGFTPHAAGALLVSPALDWREIILAGLSAARIPSWAAQWMLSGFNLIRTPGEPSISWEQMPGIPSSQSELAVPTMVFHGSADRSVPVQLSRKYVSDREIRYEEFSGAHHTLEWNVSPEAWEETVKAWCRSLGLSVDDEHTVQTLEAK